MSRGYWDYKNTYLQTEIFGWYASKKNGIPNVFEDREISEIIFDMFELLHAFDSYKSGDWSEDSWLEAKNEFKTRWFGKTIDERVEAIIESSLEEAKDEIYKTFGIKE